MSSHSLIPRGASTPAIDELCRILPIASVSLVPSLSLWDVFAISHTRCLKTLVPSDPLAHVMFRELVDSTYAHPRFGASKEHGAISFAFAPSRRGGHWSEISLCECVLEIVSTNTNDNGRAGYGLLVCIRGFVVDSQRISLPLQRGGRGPATYTTSLRSGSPVQMAFQYTSKNKFSHPAIKIFYRDGPHRRALLGRSGVFQNAAIQRLVLDSSRVRIL